MRYFTVKAGLTTLSRPEDQTQVRYISKLKLHDNYNYKIQDNDIALLRLNSPWVFNDFIQPICIPHNGSEEVTLNFSHCLISGWGSTSYGGFGVDRLQEAKVELIDRQRCNQIHRDNNLITENMLCAGFERGGVDSCKGDSGGPLQCYSKKQERFYQLGITSFGDRCGLPLRPGVYSKISRFSAWIKETQEKSASPKSSSRQMLVVLSVGLALLQI